jgi:glutamyl-tRNA reductase
VALRERLAINEDSLPLALESFANKLEMETAILSTCNRIELYVAGAINEQPPDQVVVAGLLCASGHVPYEQVAPFCYVHRDLAVVRHLFRVAAGLDSMIVGEGQIVGQVKRAYDHAQRAGTAGPMLHALFQQARRTAARVRSETAIAQGQTSIARAAVDFVCQVFERFDHKTILVIGAGKMGELTLSHLRELKPECILVANRHLTKAHEVAAGCGGVVLPWEKLDEGLVQADIILSTTGSSQPLVTRERFEAVVAPRRQGPLVVFDIAVPRDFDAGIHDGDRVCLFNIDDLQRMRERTLSERRRHVAAAEAMVEQEVRRFGLECDRRKHAKLIARLTGDLSDKRRVIVARLLGRLNGRLTPSDRDYIEGAFRLLQNQFLHGPISALTEEPAEGTRHNLLEALRKLFRLHD